MRLVLVGVEGEGEGEDEVEINRNECTYHLQYLLYLVRRVVLWP